MNARRSGAVSAAALCGLALTLALAHAVAPGWVRRVGLDVWNLRAIREEGRAAEELSRDVDARLERQAREAEYADHVAGRLVDGTLTLAEAVDSLEPVLRVRPEFEDQMRHSYRFSTYRQGVARYVIVKASLVIGEDPVRWAAVSARLEGEYAALR